MDIELKYPDLIDEHLYTEPKVINFLSEEIQIADYDGQVATNTYLSSVKKVILPGDFRYGHLLTDVLTSIVYELDKTTDTLHFIFSVGPETRVVKNLKTGTLFDYISRKLTSMGHTVTFASLGEVESSALVDNFVVHCRHLPHSSYALQRVRDFLLQDIKIPTPVKKIYISKKKDLSFSTFDTRMESEVVLESYLSSLGFTIVYPDQFETYEDQLAELCSAKLLVSTTGSSLLSSIVMAPGSIIAELYTPLHQLGSRTAAILPYYYEIAKAFNLNYLSIDSQADASKVIAYIESTPAIKSLLSLDYN